jgi:hypothetical protein
MQCRQHPGKLKHNVTYFASGRQFCTNCGAGNLARSRLLGGFSGRRRVFVPRERRLKAGCSQDWLPHNLCRQFTLGKVSGIELKHAPLPIDQPGGACFSLPGRLIEKE